MHTTLVQSFRSRPLSVSFSTAAVLLGGLLLLGCRTALNRQQVLDDIQSRGNALLYISPSRHLAAVVKSQQNLLDQELGLLRETTRARWNVRQFATSRELTLYLYHLWPPRPGDSCTYTNAICQPAPHPCVTNCTPHHRFGDWDWHGGTNYGYPLTNTIRFTGWKRDFLEVSNYMHCVRAESSSNTCTVYYRVICRRRFYTDNQCTNIAAFEREEAISGWVCP